MNGYYYVDVKNKFELWIGNGICKEFVPKVDEDIDAIDPDHNDGDSTDLLEDQRLYNTGIHSS